MKLKLQDIIDEVKQDKGNIPILENWTGEEVGT